MVEPRYSLKKQYIDKWLSKRMIFMLACVGVLIVIILCIKFVKLLLNRPHPFPPAVVSAMTANYQWWQPTIEVAGSLRAIRGVNVTTELGGLVRTIYFKPGQQVKIGDLLVALNTDSDVALLHSLQANANLAMITYQRDKAQFAIQAVSKQQVDTDFANLKNFEAQVAQQAAIVAKKLIRAPFSGKLGVSNVNPDKI